MGTSGHDSSALTEVSSQISDVGSKQVLCQNFNVVYFSTGLIYSFRFVSFGTI